MGNLPNKETTISKVLQFDKIATILGFIVDCITMATILFAIKLSDDININLPAFISPELALVIWVIAVYTYLAYLHKHWHKKRIEKKYQKTFSRFIVKDLLQHFRNPILLFPAIILIISLIAILVQSTTLSGAIGGSIGILAVVLFYVAVFKDILRNDLADQESRKTVDSNWDYIKNRLKVELSKRQWVSMNYLNDVAEFLGINTNGMVYAFAKYAFENSDEIKYGSVYRHSDNEKIADEENVLINIKMLNDDEYYFSPS